MLVRKNKCVNNVYFWALSPPTFRGNRFYGLTSCARRVESKLFLPSLTLGSVFVKCLHAQRGFFFLKGIWLLPGQAEEFKSKQISSMGWSLALEGWKKYYFGSARIWFVFSKIHACLNGKCFLILRIVLQIPNGKRHSSPWKVEFVYYCQAEEFKSKQISSMGWNLALEGWKLSVLFWLSSNLIQF